MQLGYGKHRKLIQAALTGQTSSIAVDIASDKELTKSLLSAAGIPVPRGGVAATEAEALAALQELDGPVALKPYNGCQGKGVSLNLSTVAEVEQAFRSAQQYADKVVIEEMLSGRDYRSLIVNGKLVAASERVPAHVNGDGRHTIAELIEIINQDPERGDGHGKSLTRVVVDSVVLAYLKKCGRAINDKPRAGERVFLRECANLSTGGTARDVTDQVHPEIAALCERAARIIAGTSAGASALSEVMLSSGRGEEVYRNDAAPFLAPGLGLAKNLIVDQHFSERGRIRRLLHAVAQNPRLLGVGIDEDTAVWIEGEQGFQVLGAGAVYVIDGRELTYSNISGEVPERTLSVFNVGLHVLSQHDQFDLTTRQPVLVSAVEADREERMAMLAE